MRMKQIFLSIVILLSTTLFLVAQQSKRPLAFSDILACKRLSAPSLSPDGKQLAFAVTTMNEEENKGHTEIFVMNSDGSGLKQLTDNEKSSKLPKWSPKGDKLAFISLTSGTGQIWMFDKSLKNPTQITTHYTGVSSFEWAPNGKLIAFESRVYADCETQDEMQTRDEKKERSKVKARVYENLMYRHWNEW